MAGVDRFEDLIAWQLSEQVKEEVFRLTAPERVRRDVKFCDQIHESARSAPANISEGFGRFEPKSNAYFVNVAKGSLEETRNHTYDGFKRGHFTEPERNALLRLIKRAHTATTRLLLYLKSCKGPPPSRPHRADPTGNSKPENQEPKNQEPRNPENPEPGEP
jgi:four helix bundle protein